MTERKHTRTFRSKKLHPEHVKMLNEAIRKNARGGDHNVHISYTKADGSKSDRKVRPLAVKGKSLFVAHCHERNAIRSFKVERINMIKKAFWDGFEKKAVSLKFINKHGLKGLASRAKETSPEILAKIEKKVSDMPTAPWRSGLGKLEKNFERHWISNLNKRTKNNPSEAAAALRKEGI